MVTLIILIVLIAIGAFLLTKYSYDILGFIMCLLFGFLLCFHCIAYFTVSYNFGLFVEKRNSFEQTLNEVRKSGNEYETAAIIKDISKWNEELAEDKYKNKTIFLDQYIDDRIELLKPIK